MYSQKFSHLIQKFTHKLTESEILFFERIFENQQISTELEKLQKQYIKFTFLKILIIFGLLGLTIGGFFIQIEYELIMILINIFIGLGFALYYEKQKSKYHKTDFDFMRPFFQKIYEKIFGSGEFDAKTSIFTGKKLPHEQNRVYYKTREITINNAIISEKIKKIVGKYNNLQTITQFHYSLISSLEYFYDKNWEHFTIKPNKTEKKDLYLFLGAGISIMAVLIFFGFFITKDTTEILEMIEKILILIIFFGGGLVVCIFQIYKILNKRKKYSSTKNKEFNKIFYLNAPIEIDPIFTELFKDVLTAPKREIFSQELLQLFVDFYKIRKIPTTFEIGSNSITVNQEIPKKFFNNPHISVKKNIERYIDLYLETKKLLEISKKL